MMMFYVLLPRVIPFFLSYGECNEIQRQVTGKSRVEISGITNINDFHCLSVNYEGQDIIEESCSQNDDKSSLSGEIVMKSVGFDCHNSTMTKDFAKTIKANEYPEIGIRFIELQRDQSNTDLLFGDVEIALAGKSKTYTVSCLIKDENKQRKYLEGACTFRFSDFDLEPPSKLFGAIRVKDTISVDFHLKLKMV